MCGWRMSTGTIATTLVCGRGLSRSAGVSVCVWYWVWRCADAGIQSDNRERQSGECGGLLPAGSALEYNWNWQYRHTGGELLMMGATGEPSGYYPTDSNGLAVQSEPPVACVCVIFLQSVCVPIVDGGCGGRCGEMPPKLPPTPPLPPRPGLPDPGFPPDENIIMPLGLAGLILIIIAAIAALYLGSCAAAAARGGSEVMRACHRVTNNHPHCDKLAHCVGACVARKCGTIVWSWCLGWIKELGGVDRKDLAANHQGEQCAVSASGLRGCVGCCGKWWLLNWY
jgi:hypothetical protein